MSEITRGINEKCLICIKKFTIFNPEHICKRCLRSVCKDCASNKLNIYQKNQVKKPHRICNKCLSEYNFIQNYKNHYKLAFNKNSDMGSIWLRQFKKLNLQTQASKFKKEKLKTRQQYWQSLNFSFKNFCGLFGQSIDYFTPVKNLYQKSIKNCSQYVCFFFLTHTNEICALELINIIYTIFQQNPPFIQKVLSNLKYLGCRSSQIAKLKPFTQYIFKKFMKNLGFNIVTTEVGIYILSKFVKQKSTQIYEKGLAAALFTIKDFIIQYYDASVTIQKQMVLNIRFSQFQSFMKILAQKKQTGNQQQSVSGRNNSGSSELSVSFAKTMNQQDFRKSTMTESQNYIQKQVIIQRTNTVVRQIEPALELLIPQNYELQGQWKEIMQEIGDLRIEINSEQKMRNNELSDKNDDSFEQEIEIILRENEKVRQNNRRLNKIGEMILKQLQNL